MSIGIYCLSLQGAGYGDRGNRGVLPDLLPPQTPPRQGAHHSQQTPPSSRDKTTSDEVCATISIYSQLDALRNIIDCLWKFCLFQ